MKVVTKEAGLPDVTGMSDTVFVVVDDAEVPLREWTIYRRAN